MMRLSSLLAVGLALSLFVPGCRQRVDSSSTAGMRLVETPVGPNGGMVAEVGPSAHVEIICKDSANLDIHFLGEDIKTPLSVDSATMEGFGVVLDQGPLPTRLTFIRKEAEGNHFQVAIPSAWLGKRAAVVVPKVVIAGQRWHFDFEVDVPSRASQSESPSPATDEDGRLTDGSSSGTE